MALVNIEQWRREKGFDIAVNQPAVSADAYTPSEDLSGHVAALENEIGRQADLIQALQSALRAYVERDHAAQARVQVNRPHATARVVRRPRFKAAQPGPPAPPPTPAPAA